MSKTIVSIPHPNVVYVQLKNVYNTYGECDELTQQIQTVYDKYKVSGDKFVFVFDTERVNYCQPMLLKRFADWMTSKREDNEHYLICSFVIVKSGFTRTSLQTILKLFKPSKPYNVRDTLAAVNLELPEILKSAGY